MLLLSDLVLIMAVILKLSAMGHAHSLGGLKHFDSMKLVRRCYWQSNSNGIAILFVYNRCGLMIPADLIFAAGNIEQWPFVQRGSGLLCRGSHPARTNTRKF